MKKFLTATLILLLPLSSFSSNSISVPKPFQGLWVEKGKTCQMAKIGNDDGLAIYKDNFTDLDRSCSISKVYKHSKNQFHAKWECMEEGEQHSTEFNMKLNKNGKQLQMTPDWTLQYCGVYPKIH